MGQSKGCLFASCGCLVVLTLIVTLGIVAVKGAEKEREAAVQAKLKNGDLVTEIKNGLELVSWIHDEKQTELQKDATFNAMKGRVIVAKGVVRQVGKTAFTDKTYVSLTVGKKDVFERINIQFNVADSAICQVANWNIGETHIMRGIIDGRGDVEDDMECEYGVPVPVEKYEAILQHMRQ